MSSYMTTSFGTMQQSKRIEGATTSENKQTSLRKHQKHYFPESRTLRIHHEQTFGPGSKAVVNCHSFKWAKRSTLSLAS